MIKKTLSGKIGIVIGFIIAILLIINQSIPIKEEIKYETWLSFVGLGMILSVVIGGMVSGFIIENYVIKRYAKKWQIWGGIAGSILISPLSLYYGITFSPMGGYLGIIFMSLGLGNYGYFIGICITIVIVIVIVECLGAIIGAALGGLIQKVLHR